MNPNSALVTALLAATLLLALVLPPGPAMAGEAELEAATDALVTRDFRAVRAAADAIAASGDPRAPAILQALLEGHLYYRKRDRRVVIAERAEGGYHIVDALTGEDLGSAGRREVRKIKTNNRLRSHIRQLLAALALGDPDPARRLEAVRQMLSRIDADGADLLRAALARETDPDVRAAMAVGIALVDIASEDPATRLGAVEILGHSLLPEARNRLAALLEEGPDGQPAEPVPEIRQAAARALAAIDWKRALNGWGETLFFGISLGSVLLLAAIGLAITFGVMGVINMAHGELIMLGAYTTWVVQQLMPNHIGWSLAVAVPLAFLVSGLVGVAIERGIIRFLYGRPLETLLATFGVSLVLQQLVRSIFSPLNRSVETPAWMSGTFQVNEALALTWNRLYIIVFALLVFAGLLLILKRTALGLQVRAVAQNRSMARAMGVRADWVDAATFGLGSGIAGIAGVALSQLTNVGPNLGQAYIIDSFMVVVFGGVGNLWGTLVGALSLGVVNKVLEPWSGAVLAKILVLVFIILFIQKRPRGLFPQRGRAAEG